MLNFLKKFISPPKFGDDRKDRAARYLNVILNLSFGIMLLLAFSGQYVFIVNLVFTILAGVTLATHLLLHAGKIKLTITIFSVFTWVSLTYLAWVGDGVRDLGIIAYLILIFLASLLGSTRLSVFLTAASILSIWTLFYAQDASLFTPKSDTLLANTFSITSIFILFSAILYFTFRDLENSSQESLQKEKALIKRNEELLALQEELQEKSTAAIKATKIARLQADRLQAIAVIIQKITLTRDITKLLPDVTTLVSENFGFYHVGIFQPSIDRKYVQLKAANSSGGQHMIAQSHQLAVGNTSVIGKVAEDKKPIIAFDVDVSDNKDASRLECPELPETRSQMALPLIYGGDFLGILDIQSKEVDAFNQADIEVFTTLANQIALVIENTRQFELSKNALAEMEELSQQYLRQQWSRLRQRKTETGYRYLHGTMETLTATEISTDNEPTTLRVPVKIRDQVIGLLQVRSDNKNKQWQEEDIELLQTVADRVALAIENARLLEDTTMQASKEGALSQFAATISNIAQTDKLMSVAVSELQKILQATEVSFELGDIE